MVQKAAKFTLANHLFWCFSHDYLMKLSGNNILAFEKMERGLTWDTIASKYLGFKVTYAFLGSTIWTIVFFILGIYIE